MTLHEAKQATPHSQLISELMDSRVPKTEREHAAAREIERLRAALEQQEQEPVALCDPAEYDDFQGAVSRNRAAANSPKRPAPVTVETVYETIINWDEGGGKRSRRELARRIFALYTHPPRREWRGLTEGEMQELEKQFNAERVRTSDEEYLVIYPSDYWQWQRAIEAALKEKNYG